MRHNRFSEKHRDICDSCYDEYHEFMLDTEDDARLDAAAEAEESNSDDDDES